MTEEKMLKARLIALLIASGIARHALAAEFASPALVDVAGALAAGDGIVLFSTGAPAPCQPLATNLVVEASKGDREGRRSARRVRALPVNNFTYQSDFADHHGFVLAFNLRPGRYELGHFVFNLVFAVSGQPLATFEVEPGQIVYMGQLFMTLSCSASGIRYEVRDARMRDVAAAIEQNPAFDGPEIITRLLSLEQAN
jgi:hypothetical protein